MGLDRIDPSAVCCSFLVALLMARLCTGHAESSTSLSDRATVRTDSTSD